jgi:hypothetical protein
LEDFQAHQGWAEVYLHHSGIFGYQSLLRIWQKQGLEKEQKQGSAKQAKTL